MSDNSFWIKIWSMVFVTIVLVLAVVFVGVTVYNSKITKPIAIACISHGGLVKDGSCVWSK